MTKIDWCQTDGKIDLVIKDVENYLTNLVGFMRPAEARARVVKRKWNRFDARLAPRTTSAWWAYIDSVELEIQEVQIEP